MDEQKQITAAQVAGWMESVLFVSGEAVEIKDLAKGFDVDQATVYDAAQLLSKKYEAEDSGLTLLTFAGKVQLGTKNENGGIVESILLPRRKQSLSQAMMETLSIVAYRQPVTRAEIEQIRGVRCEYAIHSLQQKNMICEVGRKDAIGKPVLFGTTEEFLRHFGLTAIEELPGREEWQLPADDAAEKLPELDV